MKSLRKAFLYSLGQFSPRSFPYKRLVAALIIGVTGGWLFAYLKLPLPWMLGSMTFCTLAALVRAPIAAPGSIRPPMTMIIGVMLGAGFSPQILGQVGAWLPSMLGLVLFAATCGVACVTYFERVAGFDRATAYFCGMPGGLVEMVVMGEQHGADARRVALIHSARILLIVFSLPFLVQTIGGFNLGARSQMGASIVETSWSNELWLILTVLAGALLGRLLRLPAANLLGPMVVSAGLHVSGLTDFMPAREIVNAAQLVLGTSIGCRFAGTPPREVIRVLVVSLGSTVILLVITLLFAFAVSRISDYDLITLMLAYSPGGLAEMSLVALGIGIEVAFVAAHHIARVFIVVAGAGLIVGLLNKSGDR